MAEENKEQSQQQPPQPEVEFVVPDPEDELFTTYANNVRLGYTHFDIRMLFGEVVDTTLTKVVVEERAHITISYLQAKLLVIMLGQAIALHESLFGEVKVPSGADTFSTASIQATVPPGASRR